MDYSKISLEKHEEWHGKLEIKTRTETNTSDDLSIAYTPGVAAPCLEIQKDINKSFLYTRRWNTVAVVTDGTAVLGLGDIGPEAGMPVMEGKCVLFKNFGDVDAFPICIRSKDVDTIVDTICLIAGSFGGINLEDISAPRFFEIERKLKEKCDVFVFHDDQHGTAIVVSAALLNALKVVGKAPGNLRIVINGAGSAGIAIGTLLLHMGMGNVLMCDRQGIICEGDEGLTSGMEAISHISNLQHEHGTLKDAMVGADVFIGVSAPNVVSGEMVASMNEGIVFSMANPVPEIMPEDAKAAGARVIGSGRSDYPNQINNVLVFPGVFRGALDVRATEINMEMKVAAARAIASLVSEEELTADYIIPKAFDPRVKDAVATAVAEAAQRTGAIRK